MTPYERATLLVHLAAIGRLRQAYRASVARPPTGASIDATIADMAREASIPWPLRGST